MRSTILLKVSTIFLLFFIVISAAEQQPATFLRKSCPTCLFQHPLLREKRQEPSSGSGALATLGGLFQEFIRLGGAEAILAMANSENKMEVLTRVLGAQVVNRMGQGMISRLINRFSGNKGNTGGGGGTYAGVDPGSGGTGRISSSNTGTGYKPSPGKTPGAANPDDTEY